MATSTSANPIRYRPARAREGSAGPVCEPAAGVRDYPGGPGAAPVGKVAGDLAEMKTSSLSSGWSASEWLTANGDMVEFRYGWNVRRLG